MEIPMNLAKHGQQVKCEECGSLFFKDVAYLFKVSRLVTGAAEDGYVPIKTLACAKCDHVNKEFYLKPEDDDQEKTSPIIQST